jgi:hypothetical protein
MHGRLNVKKVYLFPLKQRITYVTACSSMFTAPFCCRGMRCLKKHTNSCISTYKFCKSVAHSLREAEKNVKESGRFLMHLQLVLTLVKEL